MESNLKSKYKVQILGLTTVFFWGSAFPITKIAQEQFNSTSLGFLRCGVAAIFMLILGCFSHIKKPKKEHLPLFIFSGATGFSLYMIFFNTGLLTLTAATSSVIIALTPILTAIGATFIYKEKINLSGWLCIISAFIGVLILLLWDGAVSINVGLLWTIMGAFVFCFYNLTGKNLIQQGYTSVEIVTYSMVFGCLLLSFTVIDSIKQLSTASPTQFLSILYLGIFPSAIGYLLWSRAMSFAEKTSDVTNFMFVTPFVSTIIGFVFLNEVPNISTFIGGTIILVSILIFNLKGK